MRMPSGTVARRASAAALIAALIAAAPAGAAFKFLKVGMEAPDFSFRTLDDRELTLAQLREAGPATLVVFWASWSPRSEPALRAAQELDAALGGKGLRTLAVNLNRQDIGLQERGLIEKALAAWQVTLPVVWDPGFATAAAFGVVANPSIALLDARGMLVFESSGWSTGTAAALREQVEILLGLRSPSPAAVARRGHAPERKALLAFNLGRTFLRQGNRAKAIDRFEAAAEADPAWAAPRVILGHRALADAGDAAAARAVGIFREAVRLDPDDVSAASGLGEALLRTGGLEEAGRAFERALALDPAYTPAVAGGALLLARQGKGGEALERFEAALALNPRDPAVWAARAEAREAGGDLGGAAVDYRAAVEILLGVR